MRTSLNLFLCIASVVVLAVGTVIWLCSGMNRRVEKFFVNLIDQMDHL